jgi:hypothetical protein
MSGSGLTDFLRGNYLFGEAARGYRKEGVVVVSPLESISPLARFDLLPAAESSIYEPYPFRAYVAFLRKR